MAENVRVGELLTRAGILREQDLNEAIQIASDTGQMIGKVLIMSAYITKEDLQNAVEAQSLVRDCQLELSFAILALSTCSRDKMTFNQALDQLGWQPTEGKPTARLGELLLASNIITIEQLDRGLEEMRENIVPLGGVLVKQGALSRSLLAEALGVQENIRSGKLTKIDGINRLNQIAKTRSQGNVKG